MFSQLSVMFEKWPLQLGNLCIMELSSMYSLTLSQAGDFEIIKVHALIRVKIS